MCLMDKDLFSFKQWQQVRELIRQIVVRARAQPELGWDKLQEEFTPLFQSVLKEK